MRGEHSVQGTFISILTSCAHRQGLSLHRKGTVRGLIHTCSLLEGLHQSAASFIRRFNIQFLEDLYSHKEGTNGWPEWITSNNVSSETLRELKAYWATRFVVGNPPMHVIVLSNSQADDSYFAVEGLIDEAMHGLPGISGIHLSRNSDTVRKGGVQIIPTPESSVRQGSVYSG